MRVLRRPRRAAYTLVELLVVISVNTVLMAVAATLLGTLLRAQDHGRSHFEQTGTLVRLADQWRSDAAASNRGVLVEGMQDEIVDRQQGAESGAAPRSTVLRLSGPDEKRIEFFRDGDRLRRIEYQGPMVVRREAYLLTDLSNAQFTVSEAHIATLRLSFVHDRDAARDVWQIDACLARDGRFADQEPPREER